MNIPFFDAGCRMGAKPGGESNAVGGAGALLAEMDKAGIDSALVWHAAQCNASPVDGNALLAAETPGIARLTCCYTVLPIQTGETGDVKQMLAGMAAMGARAIRLFPAPHRYIAGRLSLGPLLDAACERRIPVMLACGDMLGFPAVYSLLQEFPDMVCVLSGFGDWGEERHILPLLDAYLNTYVETSLSSSQDASLEFLAGRYGPSRLLFGSGFPNRSMFQARHALLHADLTEEQKHAIASENLERLLREVRLP